jgi:hypothetical protein
MKEEVYLEDVDIDGGIRLKSILKEQCTRTWTGIFWHRMSGSLLVYMVMNLLVP